MSHLHEVMGVTGPRRIDICHWTPSWNNWV